MLLKGVLILFVMLEPRLELFDLGKFVGRLNNSLVDKEEVIELGEFEHREPKKDPFLYRLADRKIEARGKFPLKQTAHRTGLMSLLTMGFESDLEINLGYIFIETGYIDASSDYGGRYETLRLRIKHPLELEDKQVIPNCSVKLLQETGEGAELFQDRKDHVRYGGLIWVRADLSKVLPSKWFLGGRKAEDYEIRAEKAQSLAL